MKNFTRLVRWILLLTAVIGLVFLLSRPFWNNVDVAVMEFLNQIQQPDTTNILGLPSQASAVPASEFGIIRIVLTLLLTALLGAIVALRGDESRLERSSILEAHMILAVAASLMMMIIGSQLARAFGLMGAASIVRYRYSLRSPKEASSLIIALGVGMACGTGLYLLAVLTAVFVQLIFRLPHVLPRWLRGSWGGEMKHYELTVTSSDMEATMHRLQKRVGELHGALHVSKVKEKQGKYRIQARVALPARTREEELTKGLLGNEIKTFEWESLKGKKE